MRRSESSTDRLRFTGFGGSRHAATRLIPDIIPISELRQNAAGIIKRLKSSRDPVFITQRGRASAVLISTEDYEQRQRYVEILKALTQGELEIDKVRARSSIASSRKSTNCSVQGARSPQRLLSYLVRQAKEYDDLARGLHEKVSFKSPSPYSGSSSASIPCIADSTERRFHVAEGRTMIQAEVEAYFRQRRSERPKQ